MKTGMLWKWNLALTLALLPLAGGCLQRAAISPETTAVPSQSESPATPAEPAADEAVAAAERADDITVAPVSGAAIEQRVPATLETTKPVGEVIKLASSGVDEAVVLAFVAKSDSPFNLGADDIIYLHDLGVPGAVVRAMIQRDAVAKQLPGNTVAATPTFVAATWPPAEQPTERGTETSTPVTTQPTDDTKFDEALSPYGRWVEVEGYGQCWQPTVTAANPAWQPYLDGGHWQSTDAGWYWLSDYSWGWAPFHYGRWFQHRSLGWCWAPDSVWGPSWVSWRYTDGYSGWAPLPPRAHYRPGIGLVFNGRAVGANFDFGLGMESFAFVPLSHFSDQHLRAAALPRTQVAGLYSRTTVLNGIGNHNNTVTNPGLPPKRVAAATHAPVSPVPIREVHPTPVRGGRVEQFEPNTGTQTLTRAPLTPRLAQPVNDPFSAATPPRLPAASRARGNGSTARETTLDTPYESYSANSPVVTGKRAATRPHLSRTALAPTPPGRPSQFQLAETEGRPPEFPGNQPPLSSVHRAQNYTPHPAA